MAKKNDIVYIVVTAGQELDDDNESIGRLDEPDKPTVFATYADALAFMDTICADGFVDDSEVHLYASVVT